MNWRATCLTMALLSAPLRPLWAAPNVAISAPRQVVGDGTTVTEIVVLALAGKASTTTSRLTLRTSGGEVLEQERIAPGRYRFSFIPPRVVEPTTVVVEVSGAHAEPVEVLVVPSPDEPQPRATGGVFGLALPPYVALSKRSIIMLSALDLTARGMAGAANGTPPAGDAAVTFYASTGTLSPPQRRDGRIEVRYRRPEQKWPQHAIVVVTDDFGSRVDWGVLPLHGTPRVETSSAARAAVTVRVGKHHFGPLRADDSGALSIAIDVPPGARAADVASVDPFGVESHAQIDLRLASASRLFAVCPRSGERVLLFAVNDDGTPAADIQFEVRVDGGPALPAAAVASGRYVATPKRAAGAGAAKAVVTSLNDPGLRAHCTMAPIPRKPVKPAAPEPPKPEPPKPEQKRFRVALRGGIVTNFHRVVAPAVALDAGARLPIGDQNVTAGVEVGMAVSNSSDELSIGEQVEVTLRTWPLLVRVGYEVALEPVRGYVAARGGALVVDNIVTMTSMKAVRTTGATYLVGGLLGGDVAAGPGRIAVEAGYAYAPIDQGYASGNVSGLDVTAGYRYEF